MHIERADADSCESRRGIKEYMEDDKMKCKKMKVLCAAAVAFSLALTACGGLKGTGDSGSVSEQAGSGYTYVAEYVDLDLPEEASFYRMQIRGEDMIYMSYSYDEETLDSTQSLHIYSLAENREKDSFVVEENQGESDNYRSMEAFYMLEDGGMLACENVYDNSDEGGGQSGYYLLKFDKDHNRVKEVDLQDTLKTDEDYFYIRSMFCDGEGRIYLVTDSGIGLFDADMTFKKRVDTNDQYINLAGMGKDGKAYVSMYDPAHSGQVVKEIDFEKGALGDAHEGFANSNGDSLIPGIDGDFLVNDGAKVYEYSLAEEKATELFDWLDCDIFGDYVQGMQLTEDGRIIAAIRDWSNDETQIAYITKVKADEAKVKTPVTIGLMYEEQELLEAAVAFNKQSDTYHVNVKYYMDRTNYSETSWQDGITALNNALVSEDAPDLVAVSNISVPKLAAKGAFEDLNPYLDKSSSIKRENYPENIIESGSVGEKLIYIPKTFMIETIVGKTKNVGEKSGWSMEDVMAFKEKYPEAELIMGATKARMLEYFLQYNQDAFVDYAAGKCSFDSDEFKKLLQFAGSFPDEYEWSEDGENRPTLLRNDKVLLESVYISDLYSIQIYPEMFGEAVTYIGFPTTDGSAGIGLRSQNGLAMTAKAHNKDGAWAFIEFYLGREGRMYDWGLPADKTAMQKLIEKETTVEYQKDEKGELILDEDGNPIPENNHGGIGYDDWEYTYHNCTEEEIAEVQRIIAQAKATDTMDTELLGIITEEAEPFFKGQKSVDDVAKIIQSRAQVYVNENR